MDFTPHKAVVSAIGTTLTAAATAWAAIQLALSDGGLDVAEIGSVATAVAAAIGTIYAVWRVPNKVVAPSGDYERKMGRP